MSQQEQASISDSPGDRSNPRIGTILPEFTSLDGEEKPKDEKFPTIIEFGKRLPIGYTDAQGDKHVDFELVSWGWEIEEELGKLIEEEPNMSIGQYMSEIVSRGLQRIGSIDFTKLKRSERRMIIHQMYYADVLYCYVFIRLEGLGYQIRIKDLECPNCENKVKDYTGDLRTIEVKALDEIPRKVVELEHGIEYAQGRRKRITIGALKWAFMESDDPGVLVNPAKFRKQTIQHGIVSIEGAPAGAPIVITDKHLRSMKPVEINRIISQMSDLNGGPIMEIEGKCPKCKKSFAEVVDWRYSSFFGPSSL